ncbi:MAG: HAMP domain-containing sensor histidine kinase [Paracoccaceae bacterium]
MRPADLWRQSSFRLALGITLFTLATLVLAGSIGYGLMRGKLAERQDARITEIVLAIQQTSLQGDETDLVEAITTRIRAADEWSTIYLLKDPAGKVLAGNIDNVPLAEGWSTVPAETLGVDADPTYRLFSGKAGAYGLTVGIGNSDLDDLQEIVLGAVGWAALAALLVTVALAAALALRVQKRLATVESAVARLAQGDLSARLPVSKRGDDLDRISAAINASLARLASLVEAMRQVSTDIAHDLRTPLLRLRIRIEEAARKARIGDAMDDDLAAAIAQCEAIDHTFAALLRIAQIESGTRREKFAPVDLAALLDEVAEVYVDVAEDSGQTLHRNCTMPAWVMGDKELLTQLFANLIENAIRHCPAGTVITCKVRVQENRVTASVCDNGPGIPAQEHDKVLRRLYRMEQSRTSEGSGLGLALVKAVADLHGGTLTLTETTPGLTVEVQMPHIRGAA